MRAGITRPKCAAEPHLLASQGGANSPSLSALTAVGSGVPALSALETEVIDLFVQLSRAFCQPRSLAEIYGLLFISARPLTMDDLIQRLGLSKGSASQGLRYLRNIGAVTTVYVPADRRAHYQAVAELKNLLVRFIRDQFVPHLEGGNERLGRIAGMLKTLPVDERSRVQGRVMRLQSWGKRAKKFLPMVVKIMGD